MPPTNTPPARANLPQILLLADGLSGEGLRQWLTLEPPLYRLADGPDALTGAPQLVIWSLRSPPPAGLLIQEVRSLQDRWQPAPLLLLSPTALPYPRELLLDLPVQGVLECPDPASLVEVVRTLLAGGRALDLSGHPWAASPPDPQPLGFGQWLLVSGLQQIDGELRLCARLLESAPQGGLAQLLLQGRRRELLLARRFLLWLWGPLTMAWGADSPEADRGLSVVPSGHGPPSGASTPEFSLTLPQRNADGIWQALRKRLLQALAQGPANQSGQLLALDGLREDRRRDLLMALLEQMDTLRQALRSQDLNPETLRQRWQAMQPLLRQQALRQMAGPYVRLPREGALQPVADTLLRQSDLAGEDLELPDPQSMLAALLQARPVVVDGRLRGADEPQAVLYVEMLLANWLVRNAERISAEVLSLSAEWPELRRYLLQDSLLPTRNLERLRNQLNAQERWLSWVERPIQLYESRRPLFCLRDGSIDRIDLTEPRDAELKRLPWPQQLVTLALEIRDALAPQAQSLVRALGDVVVVLLTRVVGRAIGLVGRGIAQGMGRSLGRGAP